MITRYIACWINENWPTPDLIFSDGNTLRIIIGSTRFYFTERSRILFVSRYSFIEFFEVNPLHPHIKEEIFEIDCSDPTMFDQIDNLYDDPVSKMLA